MNKGDLVVPIKGDDWPCPGMIVRGPYGSVEKVSSDWRGRALVSNETKVVDVLLGTKVFSKIPIENLKVLK